MRFFLRGVFKILPYIVMMHVYIYIYVFFGGSRGRGCENLRSEDPFKADVLEFWRVFVHRGSEAKGRVVCFQKMFPKKKINAPDLLTFFLDGEKRDPFNVCW